MILIYFIVHLIGINGIVVSLDFIAGVLEVLFLFIKIVLVVNFRIILLFLLRFLSGWIIILVIGIGGLLRFVGAGRFGILDLIIRRIGKIEVVVIVLIFLLVIVLFLGFIYCLYLIIALFLGVIVNFIVINYLFPLITVVFLVIISYFLVIIVLFLVIIFKYLIIISYFLIIIVLFLVNFFRYPIFISYFLVIIVLFLIIIRKEF